MNTGINIGLYEILSLAVVLAVLGGIRLLSSPRTSVTGNRLGAFAVLCAVIGVLLREDVVDMPLLAGALVIGGSLGAILAARVTMLRIPQMVALLNGLGGMASLLVAALVVIEPSGSTSVINLGAGFLAVISGGVTFGGSMIAAGKLDGKINQRPVVLAGHGALSACLLIAMALIVLLGPLTTGNNSIIMLVTAVASSLIFGIIFSIRIGGADMPITISLLNSLSGLAASICGFAVSDYLLIAIGAVVGSAGLILTKIMCRAMNRSLMDILTGRTAYSSGNRKGDVPAGSDTGSAGPGTPAIEETPEVKLQKTAEIIRNTANVIVVPGYGMALSQAQGGVKELYDYLLGRGKEVRFAIHPVAGRMPGHMNVLLAEVDIPYDRLFEIDDINPMFPDTELVIAIGACDVVNPAAITAEGTPIYGMPILNVHEAKRVVVCNLDRKPGYSGVDNPLYEAENVIMLEGNASETITGIMELLKREND